MQQVLRQLVYTMFISNNHASFDCGERKIWSNIKTSQNVVTMIVCKVLLFFLSFLTAAIGKKSDILAGIYFIVEKNYPGPNSKGFQ